MSLSPSSRFSISKRGIQAIIPGCLFIYQKSCKIQTINRPHTALVLKQIITPELTAEIILRLKVSSDPDEYKNSIITMWSISQKRFKRLLRQGEILYKKE